MDRTNPHMNDGFTWVYISPSIVSTIALLLLICVVLYAIIRFRTRMIGLASLLGWVLLSSCTIWLMDIADTQVSITSFLWSMLPMTILFLRVEFAEPRT